MDMQANLEEVIGQPLVDRDGNKIGKISDVYLDQQTGKPEWVTVKTGLFGMHESFVPIQGISQYGEGISVPVSADQVKDAPRIEPDGQLSQEQEAELYSYYGYDYSDDYSESGLPTSGTSGYAGTDTTDYAGTTGYDTSGPTTDDAMTRSEEEMRVSTQSREAGRARLRKYVVTENQKVTVPISREEVRIEREPITDANIDAAMSGPELSEEEHEVTLRTEEAVVDKKVVPKERVRLEKDTITDEETVSADLSKERIEMEGVDSDDDTRKRY